MGTLGLFSLSADCLLGDQRISGLSVWDRSFGALCVVRVGGATTDCSPEAREPRPTCGLGGSSSSAQGKGCPTV